MGPRPTPTSPTESNSEALDLRPLILAGAAWLGAGFGTSAAQGWLPWVMLAVAAMIAVVARSSRLVLASALVVCVTVSAGALRALVVADSAVAELAQQGAMVTITGQAAQGRRVDSSPGGAMWLVPVSVRRIDGRGESWWTGTTVLLSASGDQLDAWRGLAPGSAVTTTVRLSASDDPSIAAWASARASPQVVADPGPVDQSVNAVRAGLRQSVSALPPGPAALVPALVVGDTSAMPADLVEQFRLTGLTHL